MHVSCHAAMHNVRSGVLRASARVRARNVATRPSRNVFLNDSFASRSVCGEDTVPHETHIAPRADAVAMSNRVSTALHVRPRSRIDGTCEMTLLQHIRSCTCCGTSRYTRAECHKSPAGAQSCLTTATYARSTRQCRHLRRNRRPESRRTGQQRSNRTEGDRRCHRTIRRSREVHSPGTERVAIATHRRVRASGMSDVILMDKHATSPARRDGRAECKAAATWMAPRCLSREHRVGSLFLSTTQRHAALPRQPFPEVFERTGTHVAKQTASPTASRVTCPTTNRRLSSCVNR